MSFKKKISVFHVEFVLLLTYEVLYTVLQKISRKSPNVQVYGYLCFISVLYDVTLKNKIRKHLQIFSHYTFVL